MHSTCFILQTCVPVNYIALELGALDFWIVFLCIAKQQSREMMLSFMCFKSTVDSKLTTEQMEISVRFDIELTLGNVI